MIGNVEVELYGVFKFTDKTTCPTHRVACLVVEDLVE